MTDNALKKIIKREVEEFEKKYLEMAMKEVPKEHITEEMKKMTLNTPVAKLCRNLIIKSCSRVWNDKE